MEENERHPIAGRHSDEFIPCFRSAETFGAPHDLIQLLEQLNLLIDQQFRVTDNVDQQEMCDLEWEIGLRLSGRILSVHPLRA
jgi:hypothetical protein